MASRLILTRKNEWANRLRKYKVYVDGELVDTIKNGQTEEFQLSIVNQTIKCKIDWVYSNTYDLNISDGEILYLKVDSSGKNKWLRYTFLFIYLFAINFIASSADENHSFKI